MASMNMVIDTEWEKGNQVVDCYTCDDLIVSGSNKMIMLIGERRIETQIIICNSCFEIITDNALR
jgi:hypothetical protein